MRLRGFESEYIRAKLSHFGTAHCWELLRLLDPRYCPEKRSEWQHSLVIETQVFNRKTKYGLHYMSTSKHNIDVVTPSFVKIPIFYYYDDGYPYF